MPKLYQYLGIIIYFYSNDHEPIHVHGKVGADESKAELIYFAGRLKEIRIKRVKGKGLSGQDLKNFESLVYAKAEDIKKKWVQFFIEKSQIHPELINQRIKNVRSIR